MKINKKAALNLGISTVVVMVIAMVVIGAGVSFIRTFFTQGTDALLGSMSLGEIGLHPDRNSPVVLGTRNLQLRADDPKTLAVAAYNTQQDAKLVNITSTGCSQPNREIRVRSITETIQPFTGVGYTVLVEYFGSDFSAGTFICTIRATGYPVSNGDPVVLGSEQLTIRLE